MTRKTLTKGIGRHIQSDREKRAQKLREQAAPASVGVSDDRASSSVLEQSNLDELIAIVELKKDAYASVMGEAEYVDEGPTLLSHTPILEAERSAVQERELVSIPRRPKWRDGISAEELTNAELQVFIDWRRGLALSAEQQGLHLTPYEKNLDFWRQLWRCAERSDLLVQIVDARDPDFYYCRDLARYVAELGGAKKLMLLLNKADFLTGKQRECWKEHFAKRGVDAVFFSALRELKRRQQQPRTTGTVDRGEAEDAHNIPVPGLESDDLDSGKSAEEDGETEDEEDTEAPLGALSDDDLTVLDSTQLLDEIISRLPGANVHALGAGDAAVKRRHRGTVGFVGFPNVGKSTVINALVGTIRVAMSRTPGKTKHIQTLELPELGVTLCDCPGLVFPSVAATRAHLVINNTMHIDDLRECFSPVSLIIEKVGFSRVLDHYDCARAVSDARKRSGDHVLDDAHAFLAALALSRGHLLRVGVPDENWAARKVLKDFVQGRLLHCEPPLEASVVAAAAAPIEGATASDKFSAIVEVSRNKAGSEEDDFSDLEQFLQEAAVGGRQPRMTRRKERHLQKQLLKGRQVDGVYVKGRPRG